MRKTVEHYLEVNGISKQQLAEKSGLATTRIDAIVNGRWTPSPKEREKIAAALGVTVDDLTWGHAMNPRNVRYHRFGLPDE